MRWRRNNLASADDVPSLVALAPLVASAARAIDPKVSVVLRQLSRPVVAGLLLGIGGAAALSQVLRRELYGISNLDPLAYAAAIP